MKLSEVHAQGFRCFGSKNSLRLTLRPGLNVLVGENDSGKTAVIDAIRIALGTRGEDWSRLVDTDFHVSTSGPDERLTLTCTFDELTEEEQTRFLEYCTLQDRRLRLYVCLTAQLIVSQNGGRRVVYQRRTGPDGDGLPVEGALRDYLSVTYLRPLRDAERELSPGRRSRLSQVLQTLPEMKAQREDGNDADGNPTLAQVMKETDDRIHGNPVIAGIEGRINTQYMPNLSLGSTPLEARLGIGSHIGLHQVLERLELTLSPPAGIASTVKRGLGLNNVLFMAAELLLLKSGHDQLPLLLVEEPEAHLHPQLQTRFMRMLEDQINGEPPVQAILASHSPLLAAGVDLNAMVLVTDGKIYPLAEGQTKLTAEDYKFLRRFLDATKANLFFARGILVVEGDAENLLLPAIARKLGRSLEQHGVSIVKVGHVGLFRYSRIMQRADNSVLPVPVACVADRDIPPDEARSIGRDKTERDYSESQKAERLSRRMAHQGGAVRVFLSPQWTLEFDLAVCGLEVEVHQAVRLVQAADGVDRAVVKRDASLEVARWRSEGKTPIQIAVEIYRPLENDQVSKAEVAEQFAQIIEILPGSAEELRARLPAYLVDAIAYVTPSANQSAITAPATPELSP